MKLRVLLFALCCFAPSSALWAQTAPVAIEAARYRAFLQAQRERLEKLEARPPRDVRPILRDLERDFTVRRADGQTLTSRGDTFERQRQLQDPKTLANVTRRDVRAWKNQLDAHINAFDRWNTPREGAYFLAADAKTIVSQLEASGEIRTGPLWWQQLFADVRAWLGDAWAALLKWMEGLFPRRAPNAGNVPDLDWLWPVFWVCVVALLGAILFFVLRALGALDVFFPSRRKRAKTIEELEGEDAALLRLPADELRERAQTFADAGNFREALRHRFLATLVESDARGVWRYDTRRTNWEHLEKLRADPTFAPLYSPFASLTRRFDVVRYGNGSCDQTGWNSFQRDALELENALPRGILEAAR